MPTLWRSPQGTSGLPVPTLLNLLPVALLGGGGISSPISKDLEGTWEVSAPETSNSCSGLAPL